MGFLSCVNYQQTKLKAAEVQTNLAVFFMCQCLRQMNSMWKVSAVYITSTSESTDLSNSTEILYHCNKCPYCTAQPFVINCRSVCAVYISIDTPAKMGWHMEWGTLCTQGFLHVSCIIRGKYLTCNENSVGLILCDSDFLICLHWLCFWERSKWSVSFCLRFPIAVTLLTSTPMRLLPQWEEDDSWAHSA